MPRVQQKRLYGELLSLAVAATKRLDVARTVEHATAPAVSCDGLVALPDGRLASAWPPDTVRVWDPENVHDDVVLRVAPASNVSLGLLPDGRLVTSSDRTVVAWDVDLGGSTVMLRMARQQITAFAVLPDGGLVVGFDDGNLGEAPPEGHPAGLMRYLAPYGGPADNFATQIVVLDEGASVAARMFHGEVRIWDLDHGGNVSSTQLWEPPKWASTLAAMPDGRLIVGSNDSAHVLLTRTMAHSVCSATSNWSIPVS